MEPNGITIGEWPVLLGGPYITLKSTFFGIDRHLAGFIVAPKVSCYIICTLNESVLPLSSCCQF